MEVNIACRLVFCFSAHSHLNILFVDMGTESWGEQGEGEKVNRQGDNDVTDRQPALQNDRREEKEEYAISCSS